MMRTLVMLVGLGLVTPFGAFETAVCTTSEIRPSVVRSNPDQSSAATEAEAEDTEFCLTALSSFVSHMQFDGRIPLLRESEIPFGKVDPLGRRPPPVTSC